MYTVYVHISPSNKRYFGITSQENLNDRWHNGFGYRGNKYFFRAIEKYGWENFQHIIIAKGLTKDEACWLEIELIREWDATNRNKGYNITLGGEGTKGYSREVTEETRKKLSIINTGKNNPMYGKGYLQIGENNPMYGRCGGDNPNSKKIICLTTNKIFDSVIEASEHYDVSRSGVSGCLTNRNSYGGELDGTPLIWMYLEEYLTLNINQNDINKMIEIAESKKNKKGENNPFYGKHHTEETKEKLSQARKGKYAGVNCPTANLYQVIKPNGEIEIMCGNQIYNLNSKGFLDINYVSFKKHIEPFGNIDISRIKGNHYKIKQLIEKLKPFNGFQIIKLDCEGGDF